MLVLEQDTIFQLTHNAVQKDEEDVAKQAIEFWCSICEEEAAIQEVRSLGVGMYSAMPTCNSHFKSSWLLQANRVAAHLAKCVSTAAVGSAGHR